LKPPREAAPRAEAGARAREKRGPGGGGDAWLRSARRHRARPPPLPPARRRGKGRSPAGGGANSCLTQKQSAPKRACGSPAPLLDRAGAPAGGAPPSRGSPRATPDGRPRGRGGRSSRSSSRAGKGVLRKRPLQVSSQWKGYVSTQDSFTHLHKPFKWGFPRYLEGP